MPNTQRTRTVIFRVSEAEYARLAAAAEAAGARNFSAYMRSELLTAIELASDTPDLQQRLRNIDRQLGTLHRLINQLPKALRFELEKNATPLEVTTNG